MKQIIQLCCFFVFATLIACNQSSDSTIGKKEAAVEVADMVIKDAKVCTVDEKFSIQEAVAIKNGKILFTGSNSDVEKFIGEGTEVLSLPGKFVMPGMHDAHCHPFGLGNNEEEDWFSVGGAATYEEVVEKVAAKIKTMKPGEWLIGGGWNNEEWPGKGLPVHDAMSAVSTENPIFLYRHGGNSAFVNAKALEIAGISKETPDPFGGKIYRKENGEPTGFLTNMGNNMVHKHFPEENHPFEWYSEKYKKAAKLCNEAGLTAWTDAGIYPKEIAVYKEMIDKNLLTMRSNIMLQNPRDGDLEQHFKENRTINYGGDQMLQVRSIKMYYDGALGSRGAAFFEPYLDDPSITHNVGNTEVPVDHVYAVATAALKTGMQVCPHAIGIRGNREIAQAFQRALKENPVKDHRFRSEHAEVVHPEDVKLFAEIGMIPSVQPIHCTSDMGFLQDRIGEERCRESASPWRNMINAGLKPALGSDFAVESHKPLWGIYAAVTRKGHDGEPAEGWYSEQALTMEEAIKGYTIWAAEAAFWEKEIGSLEKGKYADIVVLDTDLLSCSEQEILSAKVDYTLLAGKIVYKK